MCWLLRAAMHGEGAHTPVLLSSPYLNPPAEYVELLLAPPVAPTLLSAAPTASGFWGARGVKGLIPRVYAAIEARLLAAARRHEAPLRLEHYGRAGWTYHAKGLWMWPPAPGVGSAHPVLSVVGSSNHSERSTKRDVEFSACIVTSAPSVRAQLQEEQERLRVHAHAADVASGEDQRSVAAVVARALAPAVRTFL